MASVIVTCEHASNAVPAALNDLGLCPDVLASHVAWDPGAGEVARALARALSAPLFLGEQSRLVADLNRSPGASETVPEIAFGVAVPGNAGLSSAEREAREAAYHRPYWSKVQAEVDRAKRPLYHLSIHSFTEIYAGKKRELDLGILIDPARPLEAAASRTLMGVLARFGFDVRENEPYDGRTDALITYLRARLPAGEYAGIEIEISQRLLDRLERVAEGLIAAVPALASSAGE